MLSKIIKCIQIATLSLLLLMLIGQVQLFYKILHGDKLFVEIGFPQTYFYFSRDGNFLHGSNLKGLLLDWGLIFTVLCCIYWLKQKSKR